VENPSDRNNAEGDTTTKRRIKKKNMNMKNKGMVQETLKNNTTHWREEKRASLRSDQHINTRRGKPQRK
jgi:hypothetical protein